MGLTWKRPVNMFAKYSEPRHSTMRCAYRLLSPRRSVTSESVGSLRKALYSFEVEGLYGSGETCEKSEGRVLLPMESC